VARRALEAWVAPIRRQAIVSEAGEAYDARVQGTNRKFWLQMLGSWPLTVNK